MLFLLGGLLTASALPTEQITTALPTTRDYTVRTFEVDEGLPDDDTSSAAQLADGFLWITTKKGLARFDGVHFSPVKKDGHFAPDAFFHGNVCAASDGSVWISARHAGLLRNDGTSSKVIVPDTTHPAVGNGLLSLAEDAAGGIWFTCQNSPATFRWKDGKLSVFEEKEGVLAGGAVIVKAETSGRIWFSSDRGFGWFGGERFRPADPRLTSRLYQLAPARAGGMWVVRQDVLARYQADGSQEIVADITPLEGIRAINQIFEDSIGDVWLATRGVGLVRWRDGRFTRVPTSHNDVAFITEDREGSLWAGTHGGGLDQLHRTRFSLHRAGDDPRNDFVISLGTDTEQRLWLAPFRYPPVRAATDANLTFSRPPGWGIGAINGIINTLFPDPDGGVWFGCSGNLIRWKAGTFSAERVKGPVVSLAGTGDDNLWIAPDRGALLKRTPAGEFLSMPTGNGLVDPRALFEDAGGRLWVGTDAGGVFRQNGEAFEKISLPSDAPTEPIRFIVPDPAGDSLWIGARAAGLYRWRAGKVDHLPRSAGLPLDDVRAMAFSPDGEVWIGTGGDGLLGLASKDLTAALERGIATVPFHSPGREDGVPGTPFESGHQNAVARTRDGHLWFATSRGPLEIGPPIPQRAAVATRVFLEKISVGGEPISLANTPSLTLPPQPGALEIRYTLPYLSSPQAVRFRYRLRGSGERWIAAEAQRGAIFFGLGPGAYRFEVAAAIGSGPWLPGVAALDFAVRAAWWETAWFRALVGLVITTLVATLVHFIVRRRLQARMLALEQRHAVEQERARLARDLHDEVGANLTQISLLADLADSPQCLSQLASSAREAVDGLDAIVWATDPRNDTLASLLQYLVRFAEDFLKPAAIRCRIHFPLEVPARVLTPEFRHHVLLIVKEALNNIVKYAGATEARLEAHLDAKALTLSIGDNGCGFDLRGVAAGNGLRHLRERTAALHGESKIDSDATGTRIALIIPWPILSPLAHP